MAFERIKERDILTVERVTGEPLSALLTDYADFLSVGASNITNYYNGSTTRYPAQEFTQLDNLISRFSRLKTVIEERTGEFTNYSFLSMIVSFDSAITALTTVKKYNKYIGSSVSQTPNPTRVNTSVFLNQRESLKSAVNKVTNRDDPENTWVGVAIDNRLAEEDYNVSGGTKINVEASSEINDLVSQNNQTYDVIDNAEKLLGKDISSEFEIDEDGDISSLPEKETFAQSVRNLLTLEKGANAYYPEVGHDLSQTNRNYMNTVFVKNLNFSFSADETISDFSIDRYEVNIPRVEVDVTVTSIFGNSVSESVAF